MAAPTIGPTAVADGNSTLSVRYRPTAETAGCPAVGPTGPPATRSDGLAAMRPMLLEVAQPKLLLNELVKGSAGSLLQLGQGGNVTR